MSTTVQNYIQNVIGDGARSTKWDVAFNFTNPDIFPSASNVAVMCKACTLPARGLSTIDFKLKGRSIPIRGQVKYGGTFDCTFYSDERMKLRHAFETWIAACDEGFQYGVLTPEIKKTIAKHAMNGYSKDISLYQINFEESEQTAKYTIYNVFPTEVGAISLDSETGELITFTVTFAYSHFDLDVLKGEAGNFVGGFMSQLKDASANMITNIAGMLSSELNSFLDKSGINGLAQTITNFPGKVMTSVTSAFTQSFSEALGLGMTGSSPKFSGSFNSAISNLATGINEVLSVGTSVIGAAGELAAGAAAAVGNLAGKVVSAVGGMLKSAASSLFSSISGNLGVGDLLEKAKNFAANIKDTILQKLFQQQGNAPVPPTLNANIDPNKALTKLIPMAKKALNT